MITFREQTGRLKFLLSIFACSAFSASPAAQPVHNKIFGEPAKFAAAEKTIFYKLGDKTLPVRIFQYGDVKKTVCINLHDNETTSVEAAKSVLERKGGLLIKIGNNGEPIIHFTWRGKTYGFDPNGIFSREGIEKTLRENSQSNPLAIEEVEKFAQRLLELIPRNISCLVALHNNTDEDYSVTSYLNGHQRQQDARAVYTAKLQDVDDIVFTTDSVFFRKMAICGYNSIWQDNVNARKDGSLSVYCGEKGIRYINIETQHGKLNQYAEMLGKFLMIEAATN